MSDEVNMDAAFDSLSDWSSSDDSDIDEMLQDDDAEMMILILAVKELEDRTALLDQRIGSKMGRMCIPRNRGLGHAQPMQDYFAEVPTYPPRLFCRRYHRSLFEKIVRACKANSNYFKQRRNSVGTMGFSPY